MGGGKAAIARGPRRGGNRVSDRIAPCVERIAGVIDRREADGRPGQESCVAVRARAAGGRLGARASGVLVGQLRRRRRRTG